MPGTVASAGAWTSSRSRSSPASEARRLFSKRAVGADRPSRQRWRNSVRCHGPLTFAKKLSTAGVSK
jgi:hypothetical protein